MQGVSMKTNKIFKQMQELLEEGVVRGSLTETISKRVNAKGDTVEKKSYMLNWSDDGKTKCRRVHLTDASEVSAGVERYKIMKKLFNQLCDEGGK